MSTKVMTIFDHLANITEKKTPWDKLSEADQKAFSPYLINRWLSMSPDLIEYVDMFQQYTIGELDKKHVYQLYLDLLPKRRFYLKYIKGKSADKYNKDLIEMLRNHFEIPGKEAEEYIDMLATIDTDDGCIKDFLRKYGKTDKEINKLLKPEK
jgi:hypothetical protein